MTQTNSLLLTIGILLKRFMMLGVLGLAIHSCSEQIAGANLPPVLNVGILPGENENALLAVYEPLFAYLSESLDVEINPVIPDSYDDLLEKFGRAEVDLALFGGVTFVQAEEQFGATPLVSRDIDLRFTSYILLNTDVSARNLTDLTDIAFAFGSRQSTSGHIMPRYYLESDGLLPEKIFSKLEYSGSHETTLEWLKSGRVQGGALDSVFVDRMYRSGQIDERNLKVFWETPPYTNYSWTLHPAFGEDAQRRIRDAFLALDKSNPRHRAILDNVGASYYSPVAADNFVEVRVALSNYLDRESEE